MKKKVAGFFGSVALMGAVSVPSASALPLTLGGPKCQGADAALSALNVQQVLDFGLGQYLHTVDGITPATFFSDTGCLNTTP